MPKEILTSQICDRMGITISAAMLEEAGFEVVRKDKRAMYWDAADYPKMVDAICSRLQETKNNDIPPPRVREKKTSTAAASSTKTTVNNSDEEEL